MEDNWMVSCSYGEVCVEEAEISGCRYMMNEVSGGAHRYSNVKCVFMCVSQSERESRGEERSSEETSV